MSFRCGISLVARLIAGSRTKVSVLSVVVSVTPCVEFIGLEIRIGSTHVVKGP